MPTVRPNSDVTATGWTPSTGASVFATIDESAYSDADYSLSPVSGLTPLVLGLDATVAAGTHRIPVRLSVASGTQEVRVRLLNASNVEQGASAYQTVTTTPTTYYFTVTTTGSATRVEVDMSGVGPAPSSPTQLELTVSAGQFIATWVAPETNADGSALSGLTNYTVYWGTTEGEQYEGGAFTGSSSVAAGTLTKTVSSLAAGTWYVAVSATNNYGEGYTSPETSGVVT